MPDPRDIATLAKQAELEPLFVPYQVIYRCVSDLGVVDEQALILAVYRYQHRPKHRVRVEDIL
jgi:hypothetical protein